MDTKTDMLRKLKGRRDGYSLDRAFYIDPDYYRQDLENIWYRDWLFIGHDCEIPRAGNYFTVQVGDYPVVITRDRQGTIRALHNSCRHRGSASARSTRALRRSSSVPIINGPMGSTARCSLRARWARTSTRLPTA